MEPTIYNPSAYNTHGVYKGAGGIYKGRGVYNEVSEEFLELGGKSYPVVTIGSQKWIAYNLDYVWDSLVTDTNLNGSSNTHNAVYYDMNADLYGWNGYKCGLLYNQAAKNYLRDTLLDEVAPGWRIPNDTDINNLISFINDANNEGFILSKGNLDWAPLWTGSNDYGFNAIPNGGYSDGGGFDTIGTQFVIHLHDFKRSTDRDLYSATPNALEFYTSSSFPKYAIRILKDA